MGEYQLLLDGVAVGPIRASWEEAADDAVLAGLAAWVEHDFPNSRAITWLQAGRARIVHLETERLSFNQLELDPPKSGGAPSGASARSWPSSARRAG
jgi:hypothetical protein